MKLYIALTPYHILLSLLHSDRQAGDKVLVIDQYGKLRNFYMVLEGISKFGVIWDYFGEFEFNKWSLWLRLNLFSLGLSGLQKLRCKDGFSGVDTIYVFNDTPVSVQYILNCVKGKKVVYIEDGLAPYNSHYLKSNNILKTLKRIVCFWKYEVVSVLGTSSYIDEGCFLYKDKVRRENKSYKLNAYILREDWKIVVGHIVDSLGLDGCGFRQHSDKAVLLLPLINTSELKKDYSRIIEGVHNAGFEVFVKAHPLDDSEGVINIDSAHLLPQGVPAELLPFLLSGVKLVLGGETTSLSAIKFFDQDSKLNIHSFVGGDADSSVVMFFSSIGIHVHTSVEGILKGVVV